MTKQERIKKILHMLDREYPDKQCELHYENPFQLLIGTILAAQATDKKVNEITPQLFKSYKTPEDFLLMTLEQLESNIKQINYYKTKARHILESCVILVRDFNSKVPENRDELMRLPGVGRKTANVILSYAYQKPAIAVDTHVFRVANRLGIVYEKDVLKTELKMEKLIPAEWWSKAHSSMVLHGRRVCDAKKPQCLQCCLISVCSYVNKEEAAEKRKMH